MKRSVFLQLILTLAMIDAKYGQFLMALQNLKEVSPEDYETILAVVEEHDDPMQMVLAI